MPHPGRTAHLSSGGIGVNFWGMRMSAMGYRHVAGHCPNSIGIVVKEQWFKQLLQCLDALEDIFMAGSQSKRCSYFTVPWL